MLSQLRYTRLYNCYGHLICILTRVINTYLFCAHFNLFFSKIISISLNRECRARTVR